MKDQSLRVLIVEDSEDDALLIIRELKKGGYSPVYERVETAAAMKKALQEKQWDIILCDYKMPKFSGKQAIALLKETNIDIPLIIVSGTMGEETAVECMRLGAQDYIMKGNLSRLCPAIDRELKEAEVKNKQKQIESQREAALKSLRESEEKYRLIFEYSPLGLLSFDEKGVIVACNDNFVKIIGSSREKLIGLNMLNLPDKKMVSAVQKALNGSSGLYENDSSSVTARKITSVRCLFEPMDVGGGQILGGMGIIEDITERKLVEESLRHSEEKYRSILETIQEGYYEVDLVGNLTFFNDSLCRILGYSKEELMGMNYRQYEDKESLKKVFQTYNEVYKTGEPIKGFGRQIIRKDGTKRYVEVSVSLQKDSLGKPIGFRGISRDVTEHKQAEEKLQQTLASLRKAFGTTIQVMVSAVEMRDPYTSGHQIRSADIARAIAKEMGLPKDKIDGIRLAGSIHDIGKLSVPAEILSKPTKLTDLEFSLIKEHSRSGYEMLKDLESPWPLAEIVYQHHERMNGSGYPRNLKGDKILIEARIMAVADVVEAMASHRPYRPTLGIEAALEEIEKNKGIIYDDDVADACLKLFREKNYKIP